MTAIALIGSTGNIGSRVLDEALNRKHSVTAITRDASKLKPRPGMTIRQGSTTDVVTMSAILKGHDIVVASVKWNEASGAQPRREARPLRGRRRQPAAR
jgi:putative NADH-flavin reductase